MLIPKTLTAVITAAAIRTAGAFTTAKTICASFAKRRLRGSNKPDARLIFVRNVRNKCVRISPSFDFKGKFLPLFKKIMNKLKLSAALGLFLVIWLFPSSAFACACCAERGFYSIRNSAPTADQLAELRKLKFQTAELYNPSGESDAIKGINPLGGNFSVKGLLSGKTWIFNFKDENRKTGELDLTKPLSMVEYMVDLPNSNDGEVKLYKEWRFKYRVQNATGIFKTGFAPASEYFLVLQGYGNVCTSAEDFKKWRLEVNRQKS